jgi:putative transposase
MIICHREIMTGIGLVDIKVSKTHVSRTTILNMVYKLVLSAEKGWRKLRGFRRLADVINGVKFIVGIDEETVERQRDLA